MKSQLEALEAVAIKKAFNKVSVISTLPKTIEALANGDALQRVMNTANSYQKAMEALANGNAFQRVMTAADSYQRTMETLANGDAIQRAMGLANSYQKTMQALANGEAFRKVIDTLAEPTNLLATLDSIARAKNNNFFGDFLETELASAKLDHQLEEIGKAQDSDSFAKAFSNLPPWIQFVLLSFILHLILPVAQNVIANLVTPHVEKLISSPVISEREKVKQLKAFSLDELDLSNLRFVKTGRLLLRESPSTSSAIKDELQLGQVVTVINKQRNWTEISYAYENGEIIHGWVFSRYIEKFKQ